MDMEDGSKMNGTTSASGKTTKGMDKESACILMVEERKDNGRMTSSRAEKEKMAGFPDQRFLPPCYYL